MSLAFLRQFYSGLTFWFPVSTQALSNMRFIFSLLTWVFLAVQCLASSPTVTISNGTVAGRFLPSFEQDLFLGIPYSDPPARFQNAVGRTAKFSGDFDARYTFLTFSLPVTRYS